MRSTPSSVRRVIVTLLALPAALAAQAVPDTLADAYSAGMPVFRFLDTIQA